MAVLVLDAESDDRTVEYAAAANAEVIVRPWSDFVDARTHALAAVRTPWTLVLDADEALDDILREAIARAPENVDGYIVRRTTYFCGKPLRMWRNEPLLRLVRTGRVRVVARPAAGGSAALHEHLVCDGPVGELDGTLLHYSYPTIESYRSKFARYTSIEAAGMPASFVRALAATLIAPLRCVDFLVRRGAPRNLHIGAGRSALPRGRARNSPASRRPRWRCSERISNDTIRSSGTNNAAAFHRARRPARRRPDAREAPRCHRPRGVQRRAPVRCARVSGAARYATSVRAYRKNRSSGARYSRRRFRARAQSPRAGCRPALHRRPARESTACGRQPERASARLQNRSRAARSLRRSRQRRIRRYDRPIRRPARGPPSRAASWSARAEDAALHRA